MGLSARMQVDPAEPSVYGESQGGGMNLAQMDIHHGLSVHPRNGHFVNDGHAQRGGDLGIDATLCRSRVNQGIVLFWRQAGNVAAFRPIAGIESDTNLQGRSELCQMHGLIGKSALSPEHGRPPDGRARKREG